MANVRNGPQGRYPKATDTGYPSPVSIPAGVCLAFFLASKKPATQTL